MLPQLLSFDYIGVFGGSVAVFAILFVIDIAVKSGLWLALTSLVVGLAHKRSAAARHRLWTLGFAGCLAIPVISLATPAWTLPLIEKSWPKLTRPTQPANTSPPQASVVSRQLPNGSAIDFGQAQPHLSRNHRGKFTGAPATGSSNGNRPEMTMHAVPKPALRSTIVSPTALPPQTVPAASMTSRSMQGLTPAGWAWITCCFVVWCVGVVFLLVRLAWQHVVLRLVLRRSTRFNNTAWMTTLDAASRMLGLHRRVQLRRHPDAQSPMIAGLLRLVIVVPVDADKWDASRRQIVLLHELAHAQRKDVLTQTLAGFVCAWLWFNPLAWVGMLQMRKLRELACDDLVLTSGQPATDYADVLLSVARSYRQRNFADAVGMARTTNVEQRIRAVLDESRPRASLTRRAARTLLTVATAIVLLIGSLRLQSQEVATASPATAERNAGSSSSGTPLRGAARDGKNVVVAVVDKADATTDDAKTDAKTVPTPSDDMRTMKIFVRDEAGQPVRGAKLHVSIWYLKDYDRKRTPRNYETDANGLVMMQVPKRLYILRIWASKPAYVPEFVNFARGTHAEGRKIPDEFEFRLAQGAQLSGKVVDERGEPVPGVKVEVMVEVREPVLAVNPKPIISTWLSDEDFNETKSVTDENGYWSINNAPAKSGTDDFQFRLKVTHENYISDTTWGGLQEQQSISTTMLREGTATLFLKAGVPIVGEVTDAAGNPVAKGIVVWHDDPYLSPGNHEVQIDDQGRFETARLSLGEYPVTIVAPGFQPLRRQVTVKPALEKLQFQLQPGKRLALKVVDRNGHPIPNALITVRKWRGAESLYNWKHPNVMDSRIPRNADQNGVYVWNWAPADAVTYQVSADDFSSNTVTLTAGDDAHTVQLTRPLIAAGRVTDARTGKPIEEFQVIPVTVFRPKLSSVSFSEAVPGNRGRYEIELTDNGEDDYCFQIRVEAAGYRSAISPDSYGLGDGAITTDFSLEPVPVRRGHVVDANGEPVTAASVIVATPSIVPGLDNGELNWGGREIKTSSNGNFEMAATFEPEIIRIHHAAGYAEVLRQPSDPLGTIRLQPWSRVSGQLVQDGRPIAGETIHFIPVVPMQLGKPRFQESYRVKTNDEGEFAFDRLPPIAGSLRASLGPWRESSLTSSQSVPLDLQSGEQKSIALGGRGAQVTGRVEATGRGDVPLNKNWSLNYLIRRNGGIARTKESPQLGFDPTGPVKTAWFLDPSYSDWLATREHYFVKLSPEGQLHISGVPAGVYDLVLRLYEQPAGCLVETVGEKVVEVHITDADVAANKKDIGVIEVECRVGPRVGQNMQAYKLVDVDGREQSLKDWQGRYVLLHVWASWCAPCLHAMPDIQSTMAELPSDQVSFMGLNVDQDASQAKQLALRQHWNWPQTYAGDESDLARQLAISSVPTYFLVGPDGSLVAASTEWTEMRDVLKATLTRSASE